MTPDDYETALIRIATLMDAVLNTPEGRELTALVDAVEEYERDMMPPPRTDRENPKYDVWEENHEKGDGP